MGRFDTLRYPVHKDPIQETCKELFRLEEFQKLALRSDCHKLVRYIVYLYDKNSELFSEFTDLQQRKEAAATEAGFKRLPNGRWRKAIEQVMEIRDKDAYQAIMRYMREQRSDLWIEINITQQELYNYQMLRFKAMEKDDVKEAERKTALMRACDQRIERLDNLYAKFFGDSAAELSNVEFTELITPENSTRLLSEVEPPFVEEQPKVNVPADS